MKSKTKAKAYYEIERQDGPRTHDGQFSHLKINILVGHYYRHSQPDEQDERGMDLRRLFTIQWQGHYTDRPSDWYGRRFEITSIEHVEDLRTTTQWAERLEKLILQDGRGACPLTVVGACVMLKLARVVYDPRSGRYPLAPRVFPPEYSLWLMDYKKMEGHTYNPAGLVMARNEDEARVKLIKDSMKESEYSGAENRLAVLTQWTNAGKPVMRTEWWCNRKIETRSVELLLRSPEEEAKAAAEAAAKEVEVAA